MKKSLSFFVALIAISTLGFGQSSIQTAQANPFINNLNQEECKTDILLQQQLQNDPAFAQQLANYKALAKHMEHDKMGTVYTIPCVVHVIHLGEPEGTGTNISDAQIHSAINNLNDAYRNLSPYTGVDMEIEFRLACVDPFGNATSGITRTDGSGTSDYATNGITNDGGSSMNEVAVKALSNWGNTDYYQFWIVAGIDGNMGGGGVQGYAYFSQTSSKDGAVVLYNSFGYDPTGTLCYNLKSYTNRNVTTIHEFGHALGLYHTFEGDGTGSTCPTNGNCATDGDEVCDTPPHKRSNSDCDFSGTNSCTGGSKSLYVHNFMDYSSDDCQTEFTSGQKTKARAWLLAVRSSLTTSSKLTPVAVPVSDFITECDAGSGCEGSAVNFFDISEGNPTSWSWSFPGGTPASSTSQYPTVTYNTAGTYSVSLTATNAFGAGNTETKTGFITIYSSPTSACTPPTGTNEGGFNHVISNVTFNTINNSTSSSSNITYTDFSCSHTTQVTEGQSYNLSIDYSAGNFGFAEVMEAYIDWNDNGTFEAGELVLSGSTPNNSTNNSNTNILIPGTAVQNKLLRMRVYGEGGTLSTNEKTCSSTMFIPDVEDYGIYVISAVSCNDPDIPTLSSPPTICNGGNTTLNVTAGNLNDATDWQWYTGSCGGTSVGNGSSLLVSPSVTTTYYVRGEGGCVTPGSCASITVTVNDVPGNAGTITGSSSECENATGVAYSIASVSGATSYIWSGPVGATISSGQGTTNVTVDFATTSGNVVVTPSNSCGTGGSSNLAVTINSCSVGPNIRGTHCNRTLTSENDFTNCQIMTGATLYEFQITDQGTGTQVSSYVVGSSWFKWSKLSNWVYGTTYDISARAFIGGSWTNYGTSCPITAPGIPVINIRASQCNQVLSSAQDFINCTNVSSATQYEFQIKDQGTGTQVGSYVTTSSYFKFVHMPNWLLSTTYDISARAYIQGSWTAYGPSCPITTPAVARYGFFPEDESQPENIEALVSLEMTIYPNPNQGDFVYVELQGLSNNTELVVTDIFGKIVATQQIDANYGNYNGTLRFDKNLSSGFYMVTVISGNQKTTKKLIIR